MKFSTSKIFLGTPMAMETQRYHCWFQTGFKGIDICPISTCVIRTPGMTWKPIVRNHFSYTNFGRTPTPPGHNVWKLQWLVSKLLKITTARFPIISHICCIYIYVYSYVVYVWCMHIYIWCVCIYIYMMCTCICIYIYTRYIYI